MIKLHLSALLTFALAVAVQGQVNPKPAPTPNADEGDVIRVDSRLVVVPVSVLDQGGQPVTGLTSKDFVLKEENRLQEVAELSDAEKAPLEIALLFDVSASVGSMFDFQKSTAARFLQEVMRDGDRATVIAVGNRPVFVVSRGALSDVVGAIQSIQPTKDRTAFYDSVSSAAEFLRANAGEGSRRVIIVMSDGDDTISAGVNRAIVEAEGKVVSGSMTDEQLRTLRYKAREEVRLTEQKKVIGALQRADAVFYAINPLGKALASNAASIFGQSNLDKFALETGGSSFVPKFESTEMKDPIVREYNLRKNQDEISGIFKRLANELRTQYLIQYYSDVEFAKGRYVNLNVELKDKPGIKVRARRGYYVQ